MLRKVGRTNTMIDKAGNGKVKKEDGIGAAE